MWLCLMERYLKECAPRRRACLHKCKARTAEPRAEPALLQPQASHPQQLCAVYMLHPGVAAVLTARAPGRTPARMPPAWVRPPSAPGRSGRPRTRRSTCRWPARFAPAPGRTRGRARTRPERAASAPGPGRSATETLSWVMKVFECVSQSMAVGRRAACQRRLDQIQAVWYSDADNLLSLYTHGVMLCAQATVRQAGCPGPSCMCTCRAMLLG
jgi:hypothetical protein